MDKKVIGYLSLLIIGLISFISQVFIFSWPDGDIGLVVCIISVLFIITGIIKLCQHSQKFKEMLWMFIDLFF